MKKTIEVVAKKVDDAIQEGLRQLGATIDEVDVKVLEQGGLFKKAKVEITIELPDPKPEKTEKTEKEEQPVKPEKESKSKAEQSKAPEKKEEKREEKQKPVAAEPKKEEAKIQEKKEEPKKVEPSDNRQNKQNKQNQNQQKNQNQKKKFDEKNREHVEVKPEHIKRCEEFLAGAVAKMGVEGKVTVKEDDGIVAVIETEDSTVIGYRGEVLDSLQYLTSLALNGVGGKHIRFSLDALGYRAKREETLKRLAQKTADKCLRNNRKVSLEPMNSAERRIIHAALGDNEKVITRSEGHEPNRRVVVLPKR